MAASTKVVPFPSVARPGVLLWLVAAGGLTTLLVLLTIAIKGNPYPSQDVAIMDWVASWDLPGVSGFFAALSFLGSVWAGLIYGPVGIAFLLLLGKTRAAMVFAVVGGTIALVAILGDYTLGAVVGRSRPLLESGYSFPSGHVFGSTVFFGFIGFLAVYYKLKRNLLVPLLVLIGATTLLIGPARIYEKSHWPSDVAAGYLLGALWLLVLIPLFVWLRKTTWFSTSRFGEDITALSCESCRIAQSIASVVLLDAEKGTATKVYTPPPLVRLLYWLSFQAKFPYESTTVALQAAAYRRKIASLLTVHTFGKDLVAHVTAVDCMHGKCSFVTEYVPGEGATNDEPTKRFLSRVADTFAEAGLSIWQVNPHNPHAHTNLIRTQEGDLKIIDLESAMVTLLPAPGQLRSALRSGNIPIFDDIDFPRLRRYITTHRMALEGSLGPVGLAGLDEAVDGCEEAIWSWKESEPRLWGWLAKSVYRSLNLAAFLHHLMGAIDGADRAAEAFMGRGITRWEADGRMAPAETAALRTHLSSKEAHDALRHLGAHLVLSAIFRFPIGSGVRFAWTVAFWTIGQSRRFPHRNRASVGKLPNIHTSLVMALSLVPGFGAIAYLAARPLRRKLLVRLMADQLAWKLPFRLYRRLHLSRWLAPRSKTRQVVAGSDDESQTSAERVAVLGLVNGNEVDTAASDSKRSR